ncbi:odorant receptor 305 [Tribolium castaneum]|uniref:Odorant receptor n=1 Tax=Tribolium castaneum TaxID=7070 RepID=D6X3R0_TRICA|nr:odorant receptor 305 [Tribolium castaneum]
MFREQSLMNIPNDDCLWPLRFIFQNLYKIKVTNFIIKKMLTNLTILLIIQTYLFLRENSGSYFLKFLPAFAGSFFFLASYYSTPIIGKCVFDAIENAQLWQLNTSSPKLTKQVRREAFFTNLVGIVASILAILSATAIGLPSGDKKDFMFFLAIYESFTPIWKRLVLWNHTFDIAFVALVAIAPCYNVIYLLTHVRLQCLMLLHHVRNLNCDYKFSNLFDLFHDDKYQRTIEERLKFCIIRHSILLSILNKVRNELQHFIVIFATTGAVLFISIAVFCYSFEGNLRNEYKSLLLLVLIGALTCGHVVVSGQLIENVTFDHYEILRTVEWDCWNTRNKNLFVIYLQNSREIFKIRFTENLSVNFLLGISIVRALFTAFSLMRQLQLSRKE